MGESASRPEPATLSAHIGGHGQAFINGEFMHASEARISVFDSGFLMGVNVFDTIAVWNGWLFKLDAHVDRFYRSAHAIRLELPNSKAVFKDLIIEVTRRAGLRDAYVQCIATRGVRSHTPSSEWPPTIIIFALPYIWSVGGPHGLAPGMRILISRTRNLPIETLDPKIKTFNRLHSYLAKLEAMDAGADEVVMLDVCGYVSEGRGANVFVVQGGVLYTPPENVLCGITRETVFEIAAELALRAEYTRLAPYDLYGADEAFFCTTAGGIASIVEVDRRQVGDGRPGLISRQIADRYWQMHVDPQYAVRVIA